MDWNSHYNKLESMYLSAPFQNYYKGTKIKITKDHAVITMDVRQEFFHAAQAMHGSVYFRMLDDAAYFAVSSGVSDVFMLTSSFHLQLYRPVNKGLLRAEGKILSRSGQLFHAESRLYDEKGRLLAQGTGSFAKSKMELKGTDGYKVEQS